MQTETATRGERQLGTGRYLTENLQPRTGLLAPQRDSLQLPALRDRVDDIPLLGRQENSKHQQGQTGFIPELSAWQHSRIAERGRASSDPLRRGTLLCRSKLAYPGDCQISYVDRSVGRRSC
jgi:hypothetical protein